MESETGSSPNCKGVWRGGEVGLLARAVDIFRTSNGVDVGSEEEEEDNDIYDLQS